MAPAGANLEHGSGNRIGHRGVAADSEGTDGPLRGHVDARQSAGQRPAIRQDRICGRERVCHAGLAGVPRAGRELLPCCISVVTSTTR